MQYRQSADSDLSFIGKIITISGIIAGFGFTTVDSITYKKFFIFGEAFLFLNICLGLIFIKQFWFNELKQFREDIDIMDDIADKLESGLEEKDEESMKDGIKQLDEFAEQERGLGKVFNLLPILMIVFVAIAAVFLLLSL